jgi:hypothetical protein
MPFFTGAGAGVGAAAGVGAGVVAPIAPVGPVAFFASIKEQLTVLLNNNPIRPGDVITFFAHAATHLFR